MKIKDVQDDKLAVLLKQLPLASLQMGHKQVKGTVVDYLDVSNNSVEMEYVVDLFKMTTDELIKKWFDGEEKATDLFFQIQNLSKE
ncbi:hypothetical protein [Planococcus soli]|uniref:hypothetical protein n=1 Tax=Planococcus soli TaxID=2666072 RepID=UPI00115EFA14|nr:hypothetical protein [Planococcus soli]